MKWFVVQIEFGNDYKVFVEVKAETEEEAINKAKSAKFSIAPKNE